MTLATAALLFGACLGLGVVLVARGLRPPEPTLAEVMALLREQPGPPSLSPPAEVGWGPISRIGRPLTGMALRSGGARLVPLRVSRDLAILHRPLELHLAEKLGAAVCGLVLPGVVAALAALAGADLPLLVPLWAALVLAMLGFFVPDLAVRGEAEQRRREFRAALAAFTDLVGISLAGGSGVEGALRDAAAVGHGWAFQHLQRAVTAARVTRETPWEALARLGAELGVDELEEMASSIGLAGTDGAKVSLSLAARSKSQRDHQLADAEAEALTATERMSLPVVLMFVGFVLFLAFPSLVRILGVG